MIEALEAIAVDAISPISIRMSSIFFFFFVVHYLFETSKLNIINFLSLINAKFVIFFMSFSVTSSSSTM